MEKAISKKKTGPSYWIGTVVGLAIVYGFGLLCPAWGPVTPMGVTIIGVFVGTLVLITATRELIWPSLAALFALVIFGYKTGSEAASSFLGTTTILQVILILVICSALRESGAGSVIAKKLITLKFIKGKPVAFTLVFLLAFLYIAMFMDTIGLILLSNTVFESVREAAGYEKNDRYVQAMTLGLYLCGMFGTAIIPFTPMTLAVTSTYAASIAPYGYGFDPSMYIVGVLLVGTLFMVIYTLMIKFVFKCNLEPIRTLDASNLGALADASSKFNKKQIIILLAFVFGIAYSFVTHILPTDSSFYLSIKPISQAVWFALVVVLLCLIRIDGEPVLDARKHFKSGVQWGVVMTVGIFMMIGGALSNEELGVSQWLTELVGPIFTGMPFPVFMLVVIGITTIITNFFSNTATGIIVVSVSLPFIALFADQGMNPSIIATAIAFSSVCAFLTFAAGAPAPLLLGREGIEPKFIWTHGVLTIVVYIALATVIFTVLALIL